MGLNYSITTYIKKQNLVKSLNWLAENSWTNNMELQCFSIGNDDLRCNANNIKINGKPTNNNQDFPSLDSMHFSTSLVFDIDSDIVASFENKFFPQATDFEFLQESILGNGKIRVGGFDCSVEKCNGQEVLQVDLVAVTSDMSIMLEQSQSVKKWIIEFSTASDSILSFVDKEYIKRKIYFYRGKPIDIIIESELNCEDKIDFQNLLSDYFDLAIK